MVSPEACQQKLDVNDLQTRLEEGLRVCLNPDYHLVCFDWNTISCVLGVDAALAGVEHRDRSDFVSSRFQIKSLTFNLTSSPGMWTTFLHYGQSMTFQHLQAQDRRVETTCCLATLVQVGCL